MNSQTTLPSSLPQWPSAFVETGSKKMHSEETDSVETNSEEVGLMKVLSPWLQSDGSLTARLEAKAGQPLRVVPTFEGYRLLTQEEKQRFSEVVKQTYQNKNTIHYTKLLTRPMMAWVRESLLYGDDSEPWVAAQSIFPLPSLKGEARRLKSLQGTPIGYVLFKRKPQHPSRRYIHLTPAGWQRQTGYVWHGRPLLIAETFLPAFERKLMD